VLKMDRWP